MPAATADDLAALLGSEVNEARANLILTRLGALAESYCNPLTDAAWTIVLTAAVRLYANPTGANSETIGPESAAYSVAGVTFTRAERAALKRLGGQGGAFTIDPTPADAGSELIPVEYDYEWVDEDEYVPGVTGWF